MCSQPDKLQTNIYIWQHCLVYAYGDMLEASVPFTEVRDKKIKNHIIHLSYLIFSFSYNVVKNDLHDIFKKYS